MMSNLIVSQISFIYKCSFIRNICQIILVEYQLSPSTNYRHYARCACADYEFSQTFYANKRQMKPLDENNNKTEFLPRIS